MRFHTSWVGSVSSLMQEAAVRLLDAATVSNPPHCRRRTRPAPMSAKADNLPTNWARERPLGKHPAISSGFPFLGVRAYVSTIRKRTRAHYFPRHFDGAHTADL